MEYGLIGLAAGLGAGLVTMGAAMGIGKITAAAAEASGCGKNQSRKAFYLTRWERHMLSHI